MMDGLAASMTFGAGGDIPLGDLAAGKVAEQIIFLGQAYIRDDEYNGPGRLAGIDARDEIVSGRFTADAAARFVSFVRETLVPRLKRELGDLAREVQDLGPVARPERYRASALNVRLSIHMIENLVEHFEQGTRQAAVAMLADLVARSPAPSSGPGCA